MKLSRRFKVCPKCKGMGYVLDRVVTVFTLGIVNAIEWLFDANPEEDLSKEICRRCDGTGYIEL